MESNETIALVVDTEEKSQEKKPANHISLFYVRLTVCLIIFGGVIFVKLNNPCVFENFRFWYQNNVCEERFNVEEMKQKAVYLFFKAKEKALSAVSKFHLNNFNRS